MQQESTATFHVFPRLPAELCIQIWKLAIVDRVLKVNKPNHSTFYRSSTQVPAVTRACRESREHCSYKKAFVVDTCPRYIWANFDSDVIQMNSWLMDELAGGNSIEKREIRHLRIDIHEPAWYQPKEFYHNHSSKIRNFPNLNRFDLLVNDGICSWTSFFEDMYWGACPRENGRIVDAKTGEYVDATTCGAYQDYVDTDKGSKREYTRDLMCYDVDWLGPDGDERFEAMQKFSVPLPRTDLDY